MIYLNLVSEEIKNKIKLKSLYDIVKYGFLFILVFVIFISILFFGASFILEKNYSNIGEDNLIKKGQKNSRVHEVGNMIVALEDIQNNFIPWSLVLEDVSQSSNQGIFFSAIRINKSKNQITLEGIASDRPSLISFKENLQSLESISNFEFFNYDIFQKEDIVFNIKAKLNF